MIKVANNGFPGASPHFHTGTLVRHRRYGYRGVIVALDATCRASDQWYYSNQTQPSRGQPWYHVLVHESSQVTYAAQENIESDTSEEPVRHPLIHEFFDAFQGDHYERNSKPWPSS